MDYNIILGKSTLTNVSDAYSGTLNVSYSQYTNNGVYLCKIDTTNTTISPTLSLNGLTAYPIKRNDGTSILVAELKANAWYLFMFDQSTSTFEILNLSIPYFNGTTNYVAKYTPTGNVLGISQIFDNGTNVGIGTSTPTSKIQIVGTDSTSSNYSLKIDNSANSPLLYVRNDGNVGIGVSNPSYKLNVNGNTYIKSDKVGVYSFLKFDPDNTGDTNFILGYTAGSQSSFEVRNGSDTYLTNKFYGYSPSLYIESMLGKMRLQQIQLDTYLYLASVGTGTSFNFVNSSFANLMTIKGDGSVGIGTLSPDVRLHVKGSNSTSSNYSLKIDNSASSPLLYVRNDGVILANNLPTSASGLPSGAIWNNGGILNIV